MLPNVRLMIVATFAAILILIFGFGMFASFRVSHAPFERVASAGPLHLFAAHAATPPLRVSAAAPFNNRFEIGEPASGSVAAMAYAAPEPAEQPETKIAAPAADDHQQNAAEPAPEPPSTPDAPAVADVPASTQQAALSEAAPETKPDETPAAALPQVPSAEATTIASSSRQLPRRCPDRCWRQSLTSRRSLRQQSPRRHSRTSPLKAAEKKDQASPRRRPNPPHPQTAHCRRNVEPQTTQTTFQTAPAWPQREPQKASAKIRPAKITFDNAY